MAVFQKLQVWQDREGVSDAELAGMLKLHQTAIWRAKRGLRVLNMESQLEIQQITKAVSPADWAEWFAQTVHLRPSARSAKAQKKSANRPSSSPDERGAA